MYLFLLVVWMTWMLLGFGLFGAFFASFMLCYVMRDKKTATASVRFGRSVCDHCGATLRWYELIPVVSWIMQKGACNHCHTPLPISYIISESVALCAFALVGYALFPLSLLESVVWLLMLVCAYGISLYDMYHKELDLKLYVLWRAVIAMYYIVGYYGYTPVLDNYSAIASMLIWFGGRLLIWLLGVGIQKMKSGKRGEGFGFGDVLVGGLLGAIVPLVYNIMLSRELPRLQDVSGTMFATMFLVVELFVSSVLGIVGHVCGFHSTRRSRQENYLPFLPYMIGGFAISAIVIYTFGYFFMI